MQKKDFILKTITLLFIFLLSNVGASIAQGPGGPPLYDRLGGAYAIAAVVDDFIDRLLADPAVIANEKIVAAMQRITKAGLKFHVTEMVCQAAGGPQKYTGRTMKESHQSLDITEEQWQASVKDFLATLAKFKVPEKEQGELIAIVASTKADIVTAKPPSPEAIEIPTKVVVPSNVIPAGQVPPPVRPEVPAPPTGPAGETLPQPNLAIPPAPPTGPAGEALPQPNPAIPPAPPGEPKVLQIAPADAPRIPPPDVLPQVPPTPQTP